MSGFAAACLAYGVLCTALLIVALGCIDSIRAELRREKTLRAVAEELLTHEQIAIRDVAVGLDLPVQHVAAHLKRAMTDPIKGLR